jgi:RNA polymerase subunit RPABC4/transcription elongation factor Spt4
MRETHRDRAERVVEALGVGLGSDGLPDVAVGSRLAYATVPDWIDTSTPGSALGPERTSGLDGARGVVYELPTFGLRVLVFEAGVVVCPDASDRDVAGAALAATVTKLAGTPVDPAALGLRTVSLTAGPDGTWSPTAVEDVTGGLLQGPEPDDGIDAERDRSDSGTAVGVTPEPCSACGRVPDGWEEYCPRCGTDLKPERCASCGASLARWMLYCPSCGGDVTESI